jgi:flagellin
MRIQHNIASMNSYRNYNNNASKLSKNLEKLSSGYKINRAGDDAAGLAISEKMRAQITGLKRAQTNAKAGISFVQTAEGALQEVHDMLNRMFDLAEQSANGTYDDAVDRANLEKEVNALQDEIDRINTSSKFNDMTIFDSANDKDFVVDPNGAKITVTTQMLGTISTSTLGIAKGTVSVADKDTAFTSMTAIKTAINTISSKRGDLGAVQNRLEHTINNLSVMTENMQDAESVVRDTDVADEMMAYTKNNILLQSAQAMLAQANQMPQGVLQLLQ